MFDAVGHMGRAVSIRLGEASRSLADSDAGDQYGPARGRGAHSVGMAWVCSTCGAACRVSTHSNETRCDKCVKKAKADKAEAKKARAAARQSVQV